MMASRNAGDGFIVQDIRELSHEAHDLLSVASLLGR
jgi:hypothetical protein